MKVKFNDPGENLPKSMLRLGYSPQVETHLTTGENYNVYGISIWRNVLHYLVIPTDNLLPSWLPADLFEVIDPKLPLDWYFRYFGDNDPNELFIEFGYKELVEVKAHSIKLIERNKDAIRIFLNRKKEIDELS